MITGDFLDRAIIRFRRGSLPVHYRAVFDSDSGKIVLADLCRQGSVMKTNGGFSNEALQFAEGKRYLANYILEMLRLEPQDLPQFAKMEAVE